jgi:hypothetical protein
VSKKRIYLASSWRNEYQQALVMDLRDAGHEVYDFKNPAPGEAGFSWSSIDPQWKQWGPEDLKKALQHPLAVQGHKRDQDAMIWSNACVLLLPSGPSAHLEAGWCAGRGKPTAVFAPAIREPDLMYKTFESVAASLGYHTFITELPELLEFLEKSAIWNPGV